MDDPNITMEEYIRLEEEKAQKRRKVFNWETATYGKIWYDEDVHDLRSVETEFPAIVLNDALTSEVMLSYEPTVSPLNDNKINFRISFDEFDDEDYTVIYDKNSFSYKIISVNDLKTDSENDNDKVNMPSFPSPEPTVSCFDDLDFFNDFENEFPAIIYNDALTSKLDFLTEPTISPQHIDEFNLKMKHHCPNDNDDDKVDIEHSSWDLSVKLLPDVINTDVGVYAHGSNKLLETIIMEYLVNISKRLAIWSLNEDILKTNDSDNQYAISIKEDTTYSCLHSPKTTKERRSIRRIQESQYAVFRLYGNKIFWKISNVVPTPRKSNTPYPIPWIRPASGLRPYHFTYPERKLTMEEMLYKFIDEGKREHEQMRAFICDFKTTNEILFKERNNSLIELRFGVQELLKVINNTPTIGCEVKGVTTRGERTLTQYAQNNDTNKTNEPDAQPSNKIQTPPIPFPRRLRKEKEEAQQKKFLENLKQLHINLPFIEALAQMPNSIVKQASIQRKRPGSFTIPCDIGQLHINNALADLGASISLMPYTMYEKLGLDMPEDSRVPIILGRPFLETARAMIDVFNKKITLRVGDDEVIFDVDQSIKRPPTEDDECFGIDDLDDTINAKA
ncbi:hypothetical protein Tco_0590791 [Tanacetum coccineum]